MSAPISLITSADLEGTSALQSALLALNNEHALELSWADTTRFRQLVAAAFFTERVGLADAFLIAFDQSANYDSPNFLWFRSRYSRFLYVDRVVTAPHARGQGLARLLYGRLIQRAMETRHVRIVCEVNSNPPNPGSEALHRSLGFSHVGDAQLATGKTVKYLELRIPRAHRHETQP
jgi:uncharacterized protein